VSGAQRLFEPHQNFIGEMVERVIAQPDLRSTVERRVEERYRKALEYLEAASPREPERGYLAAICEALVSRRA
jgi:hypothetical protein